MAYAFAGLALTATPASANESWAIEMISRMKTEQAQEAGIRPRRKSAVEGAAYKDEDDDDDEMRPQRRRSDSPRIVRGQRRGVRVASLGREVAPSAPPSVSIAKETPHKKQSTSAGSRLGSMIANLGREFALPMASLPNGSLPRGPDARRRLGPMLASLGRDFAVPLPSTGPSPLGEPVRWVASAKCLTASLRTVIAQIAANFGPVRVNSTCRSRRHNARVGGAKRSYHLTGSAADFRVSKNIKEVYAFLRGTRTVGGLKHYGFGLFHIDIGPRRTW
jgi:hypothetical protein